MKIGLNKEFTENYFLSERNKKFSAIFLSRVKKLLSNLSVRYFSFHLANLSTVYILFEIFEFLDKSCFLFLKSSLLHYLI